jgi:ligand-binding sensor domain-containing protein/AraC-like DNA-binding protein/DNA-binding response OmpR family regulator
MYDLKNNKAELMKALRKIILILLLAIPIAATALYIFKTLNASNGLTSSQINCILKDSRGYVWFGTPAGLYRYDGYTFKSFQSNSRDGSSLPDSYIYSLQEALDGSLWVQTASGFCLYHPQTENFERDMRQVFNRMGIEGNPDIVYIDRHKNLWAAIPNKGVVAYNMQQQLLYEFGYTDDSRGVPQGTICSISECRDGALIVYNDGRIACCDVLHQQRTVWVTNEIAEKRLRKTSSLKAFADQMDNIWLYGQGTLMVYNKSTNTWNTTIGERLGLTGVGVDRSVNGMAGDRNGNIWAGTDRYGLIRLNVNNYEMESVQPRNIRDGQWITGIVSIQSLYIDDTDLLWVGTEKDGAAYYGKNIYKFDLSLIGDITAITQDTDEKIWYGTSDKGVIGYDGPLASLKVSAMETTPDGSIWVGSKSNGLTRIKEGNATIYSAAKDSMRTVIDDHINDLCQDKMGNLWIATNGGLQVYNPRMNSFSSYTRENEKLSTNTVTTLFYGKDNNMLVGTSEGLIILNLSTTDKTVLTGNMTNLKTFTNNYITEVLQDSRGLLWIGTREGVNILNMENDSLNYLTVKEGLNNNCICGIVEDKNKNIWITTSNGVSRVVVQRNHEDGTFNYGLYNYDTSDGLQGNEFNMGSIYVKTDGNVLLGGLYGVNWVRASEKNETESLPRVMLTQLFVGDEEILTGHEYQGRVPLPQALNESNRIELSNSQNTFTIKFAAGNYNQSERLQFMYWMEGKDDDWKNGDALNHGVTFTNLKGGTYKLHVKAISASGAISNQERTLEIVIHRPWWQAWWMLVLYAIVIIVVIYFWRFGMQKLSDIWSKKKIVILELMRQREEIKAASDELRQPMARMTSIISSLSEKEQTVEGREEINSLHFQMLQIITRLSEMQTVLENPVTKANESAEHQMQLNDKGEIDLLHATNDELTAEFRTRRTDLTTKKYVIAIIDDNEEFLKFIMARLRDIYSMHAYSDIRTAAADIDALHADIVVCKQDMPYMTGSDFCNQIKMTPKTESTKFVLMTDGVLTPQDMAGMNITLSADDYLAKPFNVQEAAMRFNKLLGLAPTESLSDLIEGSETRMLESHNASMTTATVNYGDIQEKAEGAEENIAGAEMKAEETGKDLTETKSDAGDGITIQQLYYGDKTIGDYSMSSNMDQQLMRNVEQYVLQNMSRGHINLEDMAAAMGMGRVPFFHKIRSITSKTPVEIVRDLRLKHSCVLLERTDINMSELAVNVGFTTAENFINIFKDKYGLTPLEYRLKFRKI